MCKLISHYEQKDLIDNNGNIHPLRTILISPTLDANLIFKGLNSLDEADIHDKFSDELLQSIVDDVKKNIEETEIYHKFVQAYKKAIKIEESKLTEYFDKILIYMIC
jgi:hypothetical protein